MRNVSRFRLRARGLKVESYKWLGGSNVCDKSAEVQDEYMLSPIAIALRFSKFLSELVSIFDAGMDEDVSPAANQPESQTVGHPLVNLEKLIPGLFSDFPSSHRIFPPQGPHDSDEGPAGP
eukprot:1105597-Pelagomonas_calceolata.AAC.1